jgi:hypothetical protein
MSTNNPSFPMVYNVEQSVGPNSVNAGGDVKLVQYMLRHIYGQSAAGLKIDGWIGPTTLSWIKRFQDDARAGGTNVLADGRIDRAFGQVSSVSKTVYTILVMNFSLQKKNPGAFLALPQQVPLSANPKANPYNPAKKIRSVAVYDNVRPKKVVVTYTDGSVDVWFVNGDVIINGERIA